MPLWDAQQAAERISGFTAGKTFVDYEADESLRSGLERQFEIIGKALGQLGRVDSTTANAIPDASRIIAFHNVLIHGYASVDNRLVWGVIASNLDPLRASLDKLLA